MNGTLHRTQPRPIVLFLLAAIFSLFIALAPSGARAQEEEAAGGGLSPEAQQVLAAVNSARAQAGLASLAENALLHQAAQTHANDIAWNATYSHWGSDGSTVAQRVARTGYASNPAVSENWVSSTSPDGAMRWWMNDYIHRVNILTARWQEIGVGFAAKSNGEMIFVTVFSAGRGDGTARAAAAPQQTSAQTPAPAPATAPIAVPPSGLDYVIRPGDTLLGIALRHGMDWTVVATANGLGEHSLLQIGQTVRIPGSGEAPSATGTGGLAARNGEPYTVQAGETLFSIAARNGLTWQELAAFNGMGEGDVLQIAQVIQLPVAEASESEAEPEAEPGADDAPVTAAAANVVADTAPQMVTLREGDTVFSVALAHGVDWLEVLRLNGLDENSLVQPGQQIRLR